MAISRSDKSPSNQPEKPPEEFYQLLAQHQTRLRGFVRCLLFQTAEVEDVLQETNLVLLRKSDSFELGTNFWAWASTVARYEVLSYLGKQGRKRQLFSTELLNEIAVVAEERLEDVDGRRAALETCFQQLTPSKRQLLEMRYSLGQSIPAISEATNRPEGSIRQTLYRIRKILMTCINNRLAASP